MKKMCMVIIGATFTLFGYGQTTREGIEKQIQDPQRKQNAGKADAIIARKKMIYDSTAIINNTSETGNRKTVKAGTKRKHCGNKTKK
jgi:hypothetical protein